MKIGENVKLQLNSYHFKAERGCNVPRCPAHKPGGAVLARIILFSFVRDVAETRGVSSPYGSCEEKPYSYLYLSSRRLRVQRLAAYESTARPKASERIPVIKISKDRIYIITRVGVRRSGFSEDNFV